MAQLELFLLGNPKFQINNQEVTGFNTRKDRALLAYLAVTGTAHSREHLAGLLWSDLPESKALSNLRHALSHLRKAVGSAWITANDNIALTEHLPWKVDLRILQSAMDSFASNGEHDPHAVNLLYNALKLYRGEFLQGFYLKNAPIFEEWMVVQREASHLLVVDGLEQVAHYYLAQGLYEKGLAATRHLLQLETWSEGGHRLQMELLVHGGERAAALAQYEHYRQILEDEVGAEPMPETTALYQQIQAGYYEASGVERAAKPVLDVRSRSTVPSTQSTSTQSTSTQATSTQATSTQAVPNNLLSPLAAFIGRQNEQTLITKRLAASDGRLLTIIGPGGMGKSSLALAVGQQLLAAEQSDFPDGIFWVPLADINSSIPGGIEKVGADDAAVGETILRAIAEQLSTQAAVKLLSIAQLHTYLRSRRFLLILDNFEHLLAGSHALVTLLTQAPQLKALITSRVRLNVRGESVLPLDNLSLPGAVYQATVQTAQTVHANPTDAVQDALQQESEAIAMFVQRARQLDPDFTIDAANLEAVAQICQLVEGLPLGIELATSMLPLLRCDELATELTESLDFLAADTRDLPQDQRTLAAVFDRSWHLLSLKDQQLLARLSIFPGSFDRNAAEAIAGASLLMLRRLIDQSLVSKIKDDRYILHRTIHLFAQQKLAMWPEQIATLQTQYADFYLNLVAGLEQWITGSAYRKATEQIQADLHNIQAAWYQAVTHQMYLAINHSLIALFMFYDQQGLYLDAFALYNHALSHIRQHSHVRQHNEKEQGSTESASTQNLLMGRLQTFVGFCNLRLGQFQQGQSAYQAGWLLLQQQDNPGAAALCLSLWGASLRGTNPQQSILLLTEALRLAQASNITWLQALTAQALGETNFLFGNYAIAKAQIAEGYATAKQIALPRGLTSGHKALGLVNQMLGNYQQAEEHFKSAVAIAHQHQLQMLYLESTLLFGALIRLQGRANEAKFCFKKSRAVAKELGAGILISPVLWEEGCLAEQDGDYLTAKVCFLQSLRIGLPNWWAHALPTLGWVLIQLGELAEAHTYFQSVLTDAQTKGHLPISLEAEAGLAYLATRQAETGQEQELAASKPMETVEATFQRVHQHPAATQQTRDRVAKLAAEEGILQIW